jgi:starvation-inducible DNA-binding protein
MDELIQEMKVTLASTFAFYLKAHGFHWNVEGPNFPQYHEFLGNLYEEVFGAVDPIAEHLRTLGAYAPASFLRYKELSIVSDEINIPAPIAMMTKLTADNATLIEQLTKTQALAEQNKKMGLANFLQDRIDAHEKHGWMLRSITKG